MIIPKMRGVWGIWLVVCAAGFALSGCQQKVSANDQASETSEKTRADRPDAPHSSLDFSELALEKLGPVEQAEQADIQAVFASFRQAVLEYRGEDAASHLSAGSLAYYENLLVAARLRNRDPESYKGAERHLSPTIRTNVILVTQRLAPSYLESITGRELYVTAFKQGWIGYKTLATASVSNIQAFRKDGARYLLGDMLYSGSAKDKVVMRLGFVQENGIWKIDLVPLFVGIEMTVSKFLQEKHADPQMAIDETVKETNAALEPKDWEPAVYKDNFTVKFPWPPRYIEEDGEHIYTSHHHKYGQFDVRVLSYADTQESPFHQKPLRDAQILRFFRPMNVTPRCRQHIVDGDYFIQCDFDVPEHDSQGKALFVFSPQKMYHLFNIARTDSYQNDVAAYFLSSFGYGKGNAGGGT